MGQVWLPSAIPLLGVTFPGLINTSGRMAILGQLGKIPIGGTGGVRPWGFAGATIAGAGYCSKLSGSPIWRVQRDEGMVLDYLGWKIRDWRWRGAALKIAMVNIA